MTRDEWYRFAATYAAGVSDIVFDETMEHLVSGEIVTGVAVKDVAAGIQPLEVLQRGDREAARKAFEKLDVDQDGRLSKSGFMTLLKNLYSKSSMKDAGSMFESTGVGDSMDIDDFVHWSELWVNSLTPKATRTRETFVETMERISADENAWETKNELRASCTSPKNVPKLNLSGISEDHPVVADDEATLQAKVDAEKSKLEAEKSKVDAENRAAEERRNAKAEADKLAANLAKVKASSRAEAEAKLAADKKAEAELAAAAKIKAEHLTTAEMVVNCMENLEKKEAHERRVRQEKRQQLVSLNDEAKMALWNSVVQRQQSTVITQAALEASVAVTKLEKYEVAKGKMAADDPALLKAKALAQQTHEDAITAELEAISVEVTAQGLKDDMESIRNDLPQPATPKEQSELDQLLAAEQTVATMTKLVKLQNRLGHEMDFVDKCFAGFDLDHDETLTPDEVIRELKSLGDVKPPSAAPRDICIGHCRVSRIDKTIELLSQDVNRRLTLEEFRTWLGVQHTRYPFKCYLCVPKRKVPLALSPVFSHLCVERVRYVNDGKEGMQRLRKNFLESELC